MAQFRCNSYILLRQIAVTAGQLVYTQCRARSRSIPSLSVSVGDHREHNVHFGCPECFPKFSARSLCRRGNRAGNPSVPLLKLPVCNPVERTRALPSRSTRKGGRETLPHRRLRSGLAGGRCHNLAGSPHQTSRLRCGLAIRNKCMPA